MSFKHATGIAILILLSLSASLPGKKLATLPDILKPVENGFAIDDKQIYIADGSTISIYSFKNFRLQKKFGQSGEGPREFRGSAQLDIHSDQIIINSTGKLSYFKKDGSFIKELKTGTGMRKGSLLPLKNRFIGQGMEKENGSLYVTLNLFDANLKKIKELARSEMMKTGRMKLLGQSNHYKVHHHKIFIAHPERFHIRIIDHTGQTLTVIQRDKYPFRAFTDSDEERFREMVKKKSKGGYILVKDRLQFPEYFPAISNLFIDGKRIYAATWKMKNGKKEFFVFDFDGKLVKQTYIPFVSKSVMKPYPCFVHNGSLYQLLENEVSEEWELHREKIIDR